MENRTTAIGAQAAQTVFGSYAERYLPLSERLLQDIEEKGQLLGFATEEEKARRARAGAAYFNQASCVEFLNRVYLTCTAGFLQQHQWVSGAVLALESEHYCLFTAALLNLLEVAGELYASLSQVPFSLAQNYRPLCAAQTGQLGDQVINYDQFEQKLPYFRFENREAIWSGRQMSDVRACLEHPGLKEQGLLEMYEELHGVVHPGAGSLSGFLLEQQVEVADGTASMLTVGHRPAQCIAGLAEAYQDRAGLLLRASTNAIIFLLKVLGEFGESYQLPCIARMDYTGVREWDYVRGVIDAQTGAAKRK